MFAIPAEPPILELIVREEKRYTKVRRKKKKNSIIEQRVGQERVPNTE
jgi:hypothetical protein